MHRLISGSQGRQKSQKPAARFPWLNAWLSAGRAFHFEKKRASGALRHAFINHAKF